MIIEYTYLLHNIFHFCAGLFETLTETAVSSDCPGQCVHLVRSFMCEEVLEDVKCPGNLKCCSERRTQPPPPQQRPFHRPPPPQGPPPPGWNGGWGGGGGMPPEHHQRPIPGYGPPPSQQQSFNRQPPPALDYRQPAPPTTQNNVQLVMPVQQGQGQSSVQNPVTQVPVQQPVVTVVQSQKPTQILHEPEPSKTAIIEITPVTTTSAPIIVSRAPMISTTTSAGTTERSTTTTDTSKHSFHIEVFNLQKLTAFPCSHLIKT